MTTKEQMEYIKENDFDVCPECGKRKGNTIHLPSENSDQENGSVDCANPNCGISWVLDFPEE